MKNIFKWFLVAGLFIVLLFFIFFLKQNKESSSQVDVGASSQIKTLKASDIKYVKIAGITLKVDLALTAQAQEQGLSGRNNLQEDEGMLFVFDHADKYPFWMKDMNFPIDIIWIGEDMQVVYIEKNAEPASYPETFAPSQNAKYVLEVVSSFSQKNNLKEGDEVEFLPS